MKLWDKGYDIDALTEEFTVGKDRELDIYLVKADVLGSMAHAKMLKSIGLLTEDEAKQLSEGLRRIYAMAESGEFKIEEGVEDVHSEVEFLLTAWYGETGKKIHTGRSRNDQVLVDLKLFAREELLEVLEGVEGLFNLLLSKAEEYKDYLLPGYTHLQVAMPSSFGMWFSAYAESLAEDILQLRAAYEMVNTNPLGSGAGYGSSIPLDRTMTTKLLGFSDLAYSSVYAQMQRGKCEKNVLYALGSIAQTIGRMAYDVCLYTSANYDFVHLPDRYTTGSSIMPHKKNPDIFEILRAKSNLLQSLPFQVGMICGNLPSGYSRDMQLTKELFVPAFKELKDSIRIAGSALEVMEIRKDILKDERYKYLFTVEDVNDLVREGMPFREAYQLVGKRVQSGDYRHDCNKQLHHTHEGSIGNLCLDKIRAKFERAKEGIDAEAVHKAERALMAE